jgi:hypothetical protein
MTLPKTEEEGKLTVFWQKTVWCIINGQRYRNGCLNIDHIERFFMW